MIRSTKREVTPNYTCTGTSVGQRNNARDRVAIRTDQKISTANKMKIA